MERRARHFKGKELPSQKLRQGNRAAPDFCLEVSALLLEVMFDNHQTTTIRSGIAIISMPLVDLIFVDDTGLMDTGPTNNACINMAKEEVQHCVHQRGKTSYRQQEGH